MAILSAVLPIALKLLGWFLDRSAASAESKKLFFEFVKKAGQDFNSVKLLEYGDEQIAYLQKTPWQKT